jgi:hypothetical protein
VAAVVAAPSTAPPPPAAAVAARPDLPCPLAAAVMALQVFVHLAGLQLLLAGGKRAAVMAGLSSLAACLIRADVLGLAHFRVRGCGGRGGGCQGGQGGEHLYAGSAFMQHAVKYTVCCPLAPLALASPSGCAGSSVCPSTATLTQRPACSSHPTPPFYYYLFPSGQLPATLVNLVAKVLGPLLSDMRHGPTIFLAGRSPQQAAAAAAALAAAVGGGGAGGSGGGGQVRLGVGFTA